MNIGCSSIAYGLEVGTLEPECWVQNGRLHIPLSFLFLTLPQLSMPLASPGPLASKSHPETAHPPPLCPTLRPTCSTSKFLPLLLSPPPLPT